VVRFVWMLGQKTPIHDHTVWGLVGVMRGEELCEEYTATVKPVERHPVRPGQIDRVSPRSATSA
jgi:predicted metal-dependent enzyme (double-stranded beta helix superfamily)